MDQSLPRNIIVAIQSANEGDSVTVQITKNHPIAKIRFAPEYEVTGTFVRFKHGIVKLLDKKSNYVMVPAMIIQEMKVTQAPITVTTP